jgi:transposase
MQARRRTCAHGVETALTPSSQPEDTALGYRQLLEAGRGWRDLKQVIDLRSACHRKEERIRAHVVLSWLALLLIGLAETTTGTTWNKIAAVIGRSKLPGVQRGSGSTAGAFHGRGTVRSASR